MVMIPHKPGPCPRCGTTAPQLTQGAFDCPSCGKVVFQDKAAKDRVTYRPSPPKKRRNARFEIDWEGVCLPSQFSPLPPADQFALAIHATDYALHDPNFEPANRCHRCHVYDGTPAAQRTTKDHMRPPGAVDPDSCGGCLISHLDPIEGELNTVKDRLLEDWENARSAIRTLEGCKDQAERDGVKEAWLIQWHQARDRLRETFQACRDSGIKPGVKGEESAILQIYTPADNHAGLRGSSVFFEGTNKPKYSKKKYKMTPNEKRFLGMFARVPKKMVDLEGNLKEKVSEKLEVIADKLLGYRGNNRPDDGLRKARPKEEVLNQLFVDNLARNIHEVVHDSDIMQMNEEMKKDKDRWGDPASFYGLSSPSEKASAFPN